jgi:TonB family protein
VIPDVSRSARDTIRGTIRVSIRVIVDKDGNVLAATADEPGPSRYFARLSLEAARKWTFAPIASEQQRVMLVRFYFKRSGTTARASPVQ